MLNLICKEGAASLSKQPAAVLGCNIGRYSSGINRQQKYSTSAPDGNFLHRSVIPTNHFQKSLPRLPIPKLEDTCQRYLKAQRCLLSDDEYKLTQSFVDKFQHEGQQLHQELVAFDKNNKHTSYISQPWFDMYLKDRKSIVLNYNPYVAFVDDNRPQYNDQLTRASNFIVSSLRFMKTLEGNILQPEIFHLNQEKSDTATFRRFVSLLPKSVSWYGAYLFNAYPLDMSQYGNLFKSTRIPKPTRDEIVKSSDSKHLMVMRKGNIYVFDVLDQNGNILPAKDIHSKLHHILSDTRPPAEYPLGLFTSTDRGKWAKTRDSLIAAGNGDLLKLIDGAIFTLALDDLPGEDTLECNKTFLHSDGCNRWFDKSFTLIVLKDGKTCVNFEHSWGDGVAVLRYFNEVYKDITEKPQIHPNVQPTTSSGATNDVRTLDFILTDELKSANLQARINFNEFVNKLDLKFIKFEKFGGKDYIKKKKLSPDSFMQLVIQLAYHKLFNKTAATYESCSTAAFKHGRTETIRSATIATQKVCQMMSKKSSSVAELRAALDECSKVHFQLTKEAAMGQGFDRHLFALRHLAERKNDKLPEIFTDPAYGRLNHIILSTSTLSSPAVLIGGFAPVVPDGFGIGYSVFDDSVGFNVTGYKPTRNVDQFVDSLGHSIKDLHEVISKSN